MTARAVVIGLAGALALAAAAKAETVGVRAWSLDDLGRIVFDWPAEVGYEAAVTEGRLRITFDRPGELAVDPVLAAMPGYLSAGRIEADGRTLVFDLARPVALRSFRTGDSIALDLLPEPGTADDATPSGPTEAGPTDATHDAGPKVVVRAGNHPSYGRLVFDWPRPVDYTVRQQGRIVTLAFAGPGIPDLAAVGRMRPRNVGEITQAIRDGRLFVTVTVPEDSTIRHFPNGRSVVLDVTDPPGDVAPVAAAPAKPDVARQDEAKQDEAGQEAKEGGPGGQQPRPETPPPLAAEEAVPASPKAAEEKPPTPPGSPAVAGGEASPAPMPDPSRAGVEGSVATVAIDPHQAAAAAVFLRSGYLHLVFDRALPSDVVPVVDAAGRELGPPEALALPTGAAFRIAVPDGLEPRVRREGTSWRVLLAPPRSTAPATLPVLPQPAFALGPRVLVRAPDAASIVPFDDPVAGDRLMVVPLAAPGQAVSVPHAFLQAHLLPAAQGIVVRPLDDGLAVRPVRDGVELTAADGMLLSSAEDIHVYRTGEPAVAQTGGPSRLFDLVAWRHGAAGRFDHGRQKLQQAVVDAPEAGRNRARLDLARFYLARGFGAEAKGVLDVVAADQPELEDRPDFRALRGAARVMAGDCGEAGRDLSAPALDAEPEAVLWRAVAAACRGEWTDAADGFGRSGDLLAGYPDPFFARFTMLAAEAAVETGDGAEAERLLDHLVDREPEAAPWAASSAGIHYLRGRIHALAGRTEEAAAAWREAAAANDQYHRTRAEFALLGLELEQGAITPGQAAERLERLRFAWRGDGFEFAVLRRLGAVYLDTDRHALGFDTLRTAVALFPEHPAIAEVERDLRTRFADLYLGDGAAGLSPIDAITLYDDYPDLHPTGPEGDAVTREVAERLIEIDLLGRAAALLQDLAGKRPAGAGRAELGARLASVRLLDGKPDLAIEALDASAATDLPDELGSERRLLRARALSERDRHVEALALLAEERGRPADLLRVDIAWRGDRWDEAAEALGRLVGPPPAPGTPIEPARGRLVLNRAVALTLAGDAAGLEQLRTRFAAAMEGTAEADTFGVLTRSGGGGGALNLASIQRRIAEVDLFRSFLEERRGLSADVSEAQ